MNRCPSSCARRPIPTRSLAALLLGFLVASGPVSIHASSPAHPRDAVRPSAPRRTAEVPGGRTPIENAAESARIRALIDEVHAQLERPGTAGLDPHAAEVMARFLLDVRLMSGEPVEALDGLERAGASAGAWVYAGYCLRKGSERELALRAFRRACELDANSRAGFDDLAALDPRAALAVLDRSPRWFAKMPTVEAARFRAALLVRAGDERSAIVTLRALLGRDDLDGGFWTDLKQLAPDLALADLTRRARSGADVEASLAYVDALTEQADLAAGVAYLADQVALGNTSHRLLDRLEKLDPLRLGAELEALTARGSSDANAWDRLGDWYARYRGGEAALTAWWRAFELDPEEACRTDELWRADPDRFIDISSYAASISKDDEQWGSLGEKMWLRGRHAEARAAWETARALDPDDGEWELKLESVREGRWPL